MKISQISNTVILGVIVGLIVGFASGLYWSKNRQGYPNNDTYKYESNEIITEDSSLVKKDELIKIETQSAGNTVIVSEVIISESGWVAVREISDGEMGNILGAARIKEASINTNVVVELLRPTVVGGSYAVVIYRDDGDDDFDFNFDSLVVRGSEPVSAVFQVN